MPHLDDLTIRVYPDISIVDDMKNGMFFPMTSNNSSNCKTVLSNLIDINGTFYRQLSDGFFDEIAPIADADTKPHILVTWLELPEAIRASYVEKHWPDSELEDYFVLVHGTEKGKELIEDFAWVCDHIVYTEEITMEIKKKIGRFSKIKELGSDYCFPENTDFNDSRWYQYLIDDRWIVTVTEHSNPFKNLDYDMLPKKAAVLMEKFAELFDVTVNIVDIKN